MTEPRAFTPPDDPASFWIKTLVQALARTHPNPDALRAEFDKLAEEFIANFTASRIDETWFAALLSLRDGYAAWIPASKPPGQ